MNQQLEQHLVEMGIIPKSVLDELTSVDNTQVYHTLAKDYFNDPRDPITGEVPF